jgi:GT2 family glycosyltransferase
MFFSVIIPTFKRRESLSQCLNHLAPKLQTLSSDLYEVIVTDDALADAPGDTLTAQYPWVRHLAAPQKGPAANRNNGARAAQGEWLVFLDDDCLPQPDFLLGYYEAIQQHADYRVFEGSTLAERKQRRLDEEAPINETGGYLWSCNFCIKRSLFNEIGGFCELYPYACMEDVDFREQLSERKIDFLFVPKACVIHPWRLMAPDEKYLNMLLVSHSIFYLRYPPKKPSFLTNCRTVMRAWVLCFLIEAPRLGFRGFKRYFDRQKTITRFQFQVGQFERDQNIRAAHANQLPTRPGGV